MSLHRTEYRVVILSEGPMPDTVGLDDLDKGTLDGTWVLGNYPLWPDVVSEEELTPEHMRRALIDSDSDENFFDKGGD